MEGTMVLVIRTISSWLRPGTFAHIRPQSGPISIKQFAKRVRKSGTQEKRNEGVVKPVAGEVVVIPFPRPDPVFVRNLLLREISIHVLRSIPGSVDRSGADRTLDRAGVAQE